jgi:NADPH:quinone reductase
MRGHPKMYGTIRALEVGGRWGGVACDERRVPGGFIYGPRADAEGLERGCGADERLQRRSGRVRNEVEIAARADDVASSDGAWASHGNSVESIQPGRRQPQDKTTTRTGRVGNPFMNALYFSTFGPPAVLSLKELPKPEPGKGEALIQIKAAAINPSDVKNVAGAFKSTLPRVPGRDYAGVVVDGDAAKGLEVWGSGPGFGVLRDGSHAEYAVLPAEWLSEKPAQLSMEHATTVGVPYLAAWSALVTAANVQAGETVLIVGVSGAVGRAATQIAHWKKARVIGASTHSDNPSNADAIINTTTQDMAKDARAMTDGKGADLVLDTVGGPMFEHCLKSLRHGGRQIAIASTKERRVCFDLIDFYHNSSRLIGVDTMKLTGPEIADVMNQLRAGFEAGYLQASEITTWTLERAVEAYEAVEKGGLPTKQVLIPTPTV